MKVLITGASGFLGDHIIQSLLKYNISVIATSSNVNTIKTKIWFPLVTYVPYPIIATNEIEENLFSYFNEPDILIHLAWQGLPNYNSLKHLEENFTQHYYFLKNLVKNGLKSMSVTGTCLEYGMSEGMLDESMEVSPQNPYAFSKHILRQSIDLLQREFNFSFKWIRLFYMYGAGQNINSIIPQLTNALNSGDEYFNMSPGDQIRDFLPVKTVSENILNIALQSEIDGIVNCCSGQPISVKSFVENYLTSINKNIKLNTGYYPYPNYEPRNFWGDITKLKKIKPYGPN